MQFPPPETPNYGADDLFAALGRVVVAFQLLELWVAEALSGMLGLLEQNDRHLISAAMSYRQKVDLLIELYSTHGNPNLSVSLAVIKRAMLLAEEFRNRTVHSVWSIRDSRQWVRTKSNLRGRTGFEVKTRTAEISLLQDATKAMDNIRCWEFCDEALLVTAIHDLSQSEADA